MEGAIVANRQGILGSWSVLKGEARTEIKGVRVEPGDVLDFVVDSRSDSRSDGFEWAPRITLSMTTANGTPPMPASGGAVRRMGRRRGFRGPARAASAAPLGLGRARPDAPAVQRIRVYRLIQSWDRTGHEESSPSSREGDQCQRRYESSTDARCSASAAWGWARWALPRSLSGVEAASGSEVATGNPLAPRTPPLPARARHVIHLFMNGGPSQVDTFDPKPLLARYDGKTLPAGNLRTERKTGAAFPSPFRFRKYGQSGIEVSELFPACRVLHRRHRGHPLDDDEPAEPRARR